MRDWIEPGCKKPKIFRNHKLKILDHYTQYRDDYGERDPIADKHEHYEAEKQTLMAPMPPHLVPQYNELFMQLGWILFFSMTFPAGPLFTIFAGLIRMSIELTGMSEYKQKNMPTAQKDIGLWMDLLEFVSNLGIVVCIYIIMFTSKQLTVDMPYDDHAMYTIAFATLHLLFLAKYVLAELIDDEPGWIAEDRDLVQNRVD